MSKKTESGYMPIKLYLGTLTFEFYIIFTKYYSSLDWKKIIKNYKNDSYLMR